VRLDQALAARFPQLSRRAARALIAEHRVLVNQRPVSVASREVGDGDRIAIVAAVPSIGILKITDAFVAVNKPSGIPTQPSRDRRQRSLEELVQVQLKQQRMPAQIFVVHRLDTGTSGVVVFARSRHAAATLSELFASRQVRKVYLARVEGFINHPITIDSTIVGKEAMTIVKPAAGGLIEAEIRTGRTHQIRIHLALIGHPVAGDRRYGGPAASRLMLHAWKLEHDELGSIEAPPPDDLIRSATPWKPT
jgi:23S rRNA pseudouridine1911/1915/1917 synthase